MARLNAIHPGEVLEEEFLKPLGLSQYKLALEMEVPPRRINEIVLRKRAVTADTAVRLARFFKTSEMFWMNLQSRFELDRLEDQRLLRSPSVRPVSRGALSRRSGTGPAGRDAQAPSRSANARQSRKVK